MQRLSASVLFYETVISIQPGRGYRVDVLEIVNCFGTEKTIQNWSHDRAKGLCKGERGIAGVIEVKSRARREDDRFAWAVDRKDVPLLYGSWCGEGTNSISGGGGEEKLHFAFCKKTDWVAEQSDG